MANFFKTTTVGQQINSSVEIQRLINGLVQEISKLNAGLNEPQDQNNELKLNIESAASKIADMRGRPLVYPYIGSGSGKGPYTELIDGSVKLDLINGIGVNLVGHAHPRILRAVINSALNDIIMQGHLQPNHTYLKLGEKLCEIARKKSRIKYAWLTTCGTMANENALKIIRQKHSPRKKVIALQGAFAGRSTIMSEITDNPSYRVGQPVYNEVLRIPFYDKNDSSSIEKALQTLKIHIDNEGSDICAFMFEPIQGEGGIRIAPREYFIPLFEECRKNDIAIWADEVQTFCRTGEYFAFETLGIGEYIDVCTIAKTVQVGATLYTENYNPKPGLIAGTFASASTSIAAGLEIINLLDDEGYLGPNGKIKQIYTDFISMLNDLCETSCKSNLYEPVGMGLMIAVSAFDGSKEKISALQSTLFKNGMVAFTCGHGPYKIRFLLPITITHTDISIAKSIIEKSVKELS